MIEIDQWIVDFAHLFRDSTGIEFEKNIELNNLAWDKIQVLLGYDHAGMTTEKLKKYNTM